MRIPLFMFYSKFVCGHHTNPRRTILRDFAEVYIKFRSLLQSSLSSESIKKGRLNFRVSLWKRKSICLIFFSYIKNRTPQTKTNDCFSNRSVTEYRVPQGSILSALLFNINLIDIFY